MPLLQMLVGLTFVLVLWQGGGQVILSRITLGELIAFYTFMTRLIFPMVALGFVTNIFSVAALPWQAELHSRFGAQDQQCSRRARQNGGSPR